MHDKLFANQKQLERRRHRPSTPGSSASTSKNSRPTATATPPTRRSTATTTPVTRPASPVRRTSWSTATTTTAPCRPEVAEIFDYELQAAKALLEAGIPRAQVYAELMKDAKATRGGGGAARAAKQRKARRTRPGQDLPRARRRAPAVRSRRRPGHHRRVLRLPVPVLQPRQRRGRPGQADLRQRRAGRVPPAPAVVPRQCPAGGHGRARGPSPGQVLGDARQAVRQPEGARQGRRW